MKTGLQWIERSNSFVINIACFRGQVYKGDKEEPGGSWIVWVCDGAESELAMAAAGRKTSISKGKGEVLRVLGEVREALSKAGL